MPLVIIRDQEARRRYGVGETTWRTLSREAGFPRPIFITAKIKGRLEHEIDADIQRRADARGGETK